MKIQRNETRRSGKIRKKTKGNESCYSKPRKQHRWGSQKILCQTISLVPHRSTVFSVKAALSSNKMFDQESLKYENHSVVKLKLLRKYRRLNQTLATFGSKIWQQNLKRLQCLCYHRVSRWNMYILIYPRINLSNLSQLSKKMPT